MFAAAGILLVSLIRGELSVPEMLFAYVPTAFLLSSLSMLVGTLSTREHAASMVCGILWLAELMTQSLLRIPLVQYFYLFDCFAGVKGGVWPVNKGILCAFGAGIWWSLWQRKIWPSLGNADRQ